MTVNSFQTVLELIAECDAQPPRVAVVYGYCKTATPDNEAYAVFLEGQHDDMASAPDIDSYRVLYDRQGLTAAGEARAALLKD